MQHLYYHSPIGILRLSSDDEFLHEILFVNEGEEQPDTIPHAIQQCATQLDEYFSGRRKSFSLPLQLTGTDFQKRIWTLLLQIPFGKTISYLDLALQAGDRKLIRAVGLANGANPIAIVVPCHRVIGSNGKLIGYAGGLWRKEWLLKFEGKDYQPELFEAERISENT